MIGRRVGNYILEDVLGHGGMGSVYRARHVALANRLVAIKVMSRGLEAEDEFRRRFDREASLQAEIQHPNVARVLDYFEEGGQWFLVVDYLDHGSLAEVLARDGRVSVEQAIRWVRQALAGLGAAHERGIVHRDIKPANLLLNERNEVVVADFGIARSASASGLTSTGIAIGTPQYMSPEQIQAPDQVDRRTDLYSLGIVLYELLTSRKPFDAGSQFSILSAQVSEPPPPLREIDAKIPQPLEALVLRALAKRPEDRFADCAAMAWELERVGQLYATGRIEGGATVRVTGDDGLAEGATLHFQGMPKEDVRVAAAAAPSAGAEGIQGKARTFKRRLWAAVCAVLAVAVFASYVLSKVGKEKVGEQVSEERPITSDLNSNHGSEFNSDSGSNVGQDPTKPETGSNGTSGSSSPSEPSDPPPNPPSKPAPPVVPPKLPSSSEPPGSIPPVPPGLPSSFPTTLPALPERPQVAVLAMGDPILVAGLEREIERRLGRSFDVVDERGVPEVDALIASQGAAVSHQALGKHLLAGGFHVLVLLRSEEGERRTVEMRDITGTFKAARVRMNAYLLPTQRSVGRGWTELVEYTELSAAAQAKRALIGPTADLVSALRTDWGRLLAASSATGHGVMPEAMPGAQR